MRLRARKRRRRLEGGAEPRGCCPETLARYWRDRAVPTMADYDRRSVFGRALVSFYGYDALAEAGGCPERDVPRRLGREGEFMVFWEEFNRGHAEAEAEAVTQQRAAAARFLDGWDL